jgi:hypothetical protein
VRKWTLSACVVLAWSIIVSMTAAAGSLSPGPAQASTSTASITQAAPATAPGNAQATLTSESATAMTARTAGPAARPAATWTVRPGDTLSAIAAALGLPQWLEDVLLAAGLLAATAFAAEPAAALARRGAAPAAASGPSARTRYRGAGRARRAAGKRARIILSDHERLIVTYCAREHTVYVFTPPGEDPRAVLRAARLVLPERAYEQLAGHLGIPSAWPRE